MNNGPSTMDAAQPHDRPEADDPRIIRIGVRWFQMAAEEGLTPYESAVAWKRVAHTLLREATFKVATGHLLRTLASELLEEIPGEGSHKATKPRREEEIFQPAMAQGLRIESILTKEGPEQPRGFASFEISGVLDTNASALCGFVASCEKKGA